MTASKAFFSATFGWTFIDYGLGYAGIQKADGGGWAACTRRDRSQR
ncbi:MAG: putative enzyme related to lactoylglutathione lyase [Myxococcota bacterium]|jgi:predicted enzyme related to lactoylglutathione lyase